MRNDKETLHMLYELLDCLYPRMHFDLLLCNVIN